MQAPWSLLLISLPYIRLPITKLQPPLVLDSLLDIKAPPISFPSMLSSRETGQYGVACMPGLLSSCRSSRDRCRWMSSKPGSALEIGRCRKQLSTFARSGSWSASPAAISVYTSVYQLTPRCYRSEHHATLPWVVLRPSPRSIL